MKSSSAVTVGIQDVSSPVLQAVAIYIPDPRWSLLSSLPPAAFASANREQSTAQQPLPTYLYAHDSHPSTGYLRFSAHDAYRYIRRTSSEHFTVILLAASMLWPINGPKALVYNIPYSAKFSRRMFFADWSGTVKRRK